MRVFLLLLLLVQTTWIGLELGFIANHYAFLEEVYLQGLHNADRAIALQSERLKKCEL